MMKASSPKNIKTVPNVDKKPGGEHGKSLEQTENEESKMQKFGIKVLPININPKMGIQSVTGGKKMKSNSPEDSVKLVSQKNSDPGRIEDGRDDVDGNKDNVKTLITKGLHNLKEKINQNSLGRRKREQNEEESSPKQIKVQNSINESLSKQNAIEEDKSNVPVPKVRSSVPAGITSEITSSVPEEVTRAGVVARSNRKSVVAEEGKREIDADNNFKIVRDEDHSASDTSSESGNVQDESKKPKRSKGKAPAPPQAGGKEAKSADVDAITNDADFVRDDMNIFEPTETEIKNERSFIETYDSDSDTDMQDLDDKKSGTKIELSATQVTIHHSPTSDTGNEEEIETSRKAASLGDLSKLDSDHTLSVVLERAVSLDLADGTSQCGKKRKAPLPPAEEFPAVFDEMGYKKEPRLENSLGLNTFQRRLKKSSDFGTLEDALQDGSKSLEFEPKKNPPLDIAEANNSNIQEFSSWLAECRKQKDKDQVLPVKATSKSLVNVNMSEEIPDDNLKDYPASNVTFSVNGKNLKDFEIDETTTEPANNFTVLVISQPNSLEPIITEGVSMNVSAGDDVGANSSEQQLSPPVTEAEKSDEVPPKLPTSPIPVISNTTLSSPLSKSLTYVTEIKVSTSSEENMHGNEEAIAAIEGRDNEREEVPTGNSITELVNKYSHNSQNEEITVNNESVGFEGTKRGSDFEASRIPIRTMKSETGQRVLATIQSLAAKESPLKAPEVEYAKRVASLFSNQKPVPVRQGKFDSETSGFYLSTSPKKSAPTRKVPPTVPPRKVDTSLVSKSAVVALPGKPAAREKGISPESSDRNIIRFSSFMPKTTNSEENLPKIVNWKENSKDVGDINGGHVQIDSGVVHLPVKTSATKIIFENKDADKEEL